MMLFKENGSLFESKTEIKKNKKRRSKTVQNIMDHSNQQSEGENHEVWL